MDRRKWAEEQLDELEAAHVEALRAALERRGRREAHFNRGELRLYVSGVAVLDKIYLDKAAGRLTEAYWRWLLLSGPAREAGDLRWTCGARRRRPMRLRPRNSSTAWRHLAEEVAAIEADERALNEMLYESLQALAGRAKSCGERARAPQRGAAGG